MSADNFNSLIAEFCKSVDMTTPVINDDGYYSFVLDDDQIIEIQYDTDSAMLSFLVQLGLITSTKRENVIKDILDANVLWRGTGGATLGLDSSTGIVTLGYQEGAEHMTYSRFESIIGLMIANAETWLNRIASESSAQPYAKSKDLPPGMTAV